MFSVLPLAGMAVVRHRAALRAMLALLAPMIGLSIPWTCYQKCYEPPGNHLLKWHLAGVEKVDARTFPDALRTRYQEVGWSGALEARKSNIAALWRGDWSNAFSFRAGVAGAARQTDEFYFTFRSLGGWFLGLGGLVVLMIRRTNSSFRKGGLWSRHVGALAWLALTFVFWIGLMFLPNSTVVHQGSMVAQLLMLGLLSAWAALAGPWIFGGVALFQAAQFAVTWLPAHLESKVPMSVPAVAACAASAGLLVWMGAVRRR